MVLRIITGHVDKSLLNFKKENANIKDVFISGYEKTVLFNMIIFSCEIGCRCWCWKP